MSAVPSASTHETRIAWLDGWATGLGLRLELDGEVGFGRDCVGIMDDNTGCYLDYDEDSHADPGDLAPNAYHKHDCVAVLAQGAGDPVDELYDWCRDLAARSPRIERRGRNLADVASVFFGARDRAVIVCVARS